MKTYYQILNVSEDASQSEIKGAFKKLALQWHPDKNQDNPNAEELFKELNNAYQILSNPYSRYRYDMTIKFGSFEAPPPPSPSPQQEYTGYRRRPRRPVYRRQPLMSKENLTATMYAFLFAFVVGLFVKIGVWATEYYRAMEHEALLSERREVFSKAQSAFDNGRIKESLLILDEMGRFFESEMDIRDYKDNLKAFVLESAKNSLENKEYQSALRFYGILEDFAIGNSMNILLNKAVAYKGLGDYEMAIQTYQALYFKGYQSLSFYLEMGELYETGLQDYESALNYYDKAGKMAADHYENVFGKAYPVMINAGLIPKQHYGLFLKLTNAYYMAEDYEMAVKSVIWTKEVWRDSAEVHLLSAKCYQALGETNLACQDFRKAKQLDSTIKVPEPC